MSDIDPSWVCSICLEEPFDESPIVYCDGEGCEVAVHPDCYGTPLSSRIPEDDWYCDACRFAAISLGSVQCVLCPNECGALKRTTDARWVHVQCAMWVPEAFFRLPEGKEAIDVLRIPSYRWRDKCYLCELSSGACVRCSEKGCSKSFHVSCGLQQKLLFSYEEKTDEPDVIFAACGKHSKKWTRK